MKGLHTLCDGGYHRWLHTICGYKHADELEVQAWSKLCESIRKDAECVFGIMKKRFRILSCPFLDHEVSRLDATMKVCAILHNMWVRSSGLSNIGSEAEHWQRVDNLEASNYGLDLRAMGSNLVGRQGIWEEETLTDVGYEQKRVALVRHYALALQAGEVHKMRTAVEILKMLEEEDVVDA